MNSNKFVFLLLSYEGLQLAESKSIFDRYYRDKSGKIDARELQEAFLILGYAVSLVVLDLLVLKFDKTRGKSRAIKYDSFIECCLKVKVRKKEIVYNIDVGDGCSPVTPALFSLFPPLPRSVDSRCQRGFC